MVIIPPWAYAAAAGLTLATGFYGGWTVRTWRCEAAQARLIAAAEKQRVVDQAHADTVSTDYEKGRSDAITTTAARQSGIRTVYRNVAVPGACVPAADAIGMLDQAIADANRAAGQSGGTLPSDSATP